jgi:hypothetical protein
MKTAVQPRNDGAKRVVVVGFHGRITRVTVPMFPPW